MGKLLNSYLSYEELQALLTNGESIHQQKNGYNALHAAVLVSVDREPKMKRLIDAGVDVNGQDGNVFYHNTPLHILIVNEARASSLYLIKEAADKIDYGVTDIEGKTTLIMAAKMNMSGVALEILKHIPENNIILNKQDKDGMSALHYACLYGNKALAEALINQGATMELFNNNQKTPLDCLVAGEDSIKQALHSISIDPNRDEKAQFNVFVDKQIQPLMPLDLITNQPRLLELPVRIEFIPRLNDELQRFKFLDTVSLLKNIISPIAEEQKEFIREQMNALTGIALCDSLVNSATNLKTHFIESGYYSDFLLRMEAYSGNEYMVRTMVNNQKDRINEFGLPSRRTALHQSAIKGHKTICEILLQAGADINALDKDENTPLLLAISSKHYELAKVLVMLGADIGMTNKAQKNALTLLHSQGQHELKQDLIQLQRQFENQELLSSPIADFAYIYP